MSKSVWYWAAKFGDGAVGDRFVIACGQDDLWRRVRQELDADDQVYWGAINGGGHSILNGILDLAIQTAPNYGIDRNRFMLEAAQIPAFAKYLRSAKYDLCNYIDNPIVADMVIRPRSYSEAEKNRLGHIVSRTLNIEPTWF
jgi:hypothetical protein